MIIAALVEGDLRVVLYADLKDEYSHEYEKVVLKFTLIGEAYLESPEIFRIETILKKYSAKYPKEASPELYKEIVARFLKLLHKIGH
jgi:hypothetical protein